MLSCDRFAVNIEQPLSFEEKITVLWNVTLFNRVKNLRTFLRNVLSSSSSKVYIMITAMRAEKPHITFCKF
jgi:hypothetical protein